MNDRSLRQLPSVWVVQQMGYRVKTDSILPRPLRLWPFYVWSEDFKDLKKSLGNIFVGFTFDKKPVYARDLKAENAMAILLKDAIKPNLVQTLEKNPAIFHGGPFANIAQGTNSILATKIGLSLVKLRSHRSRVWC